MVSSSSGRLRRLCSLDNDAIVSILSKLPVKSLIRFRCVCKSWCALISDPSFARMHLSSMNTKSFKLLLGTSPLRSVDYEPLFKYIGGHVERTRELDYPVMIPTSSSKFFGSFNGLICLALDYDNIILWNPCTGDSKLLPKPATFFHNNNESSFYGFGYDSTTKDYKVVGGSSNHNTVEVFALKTGSWKIHRDINRHVRLNGQGCLLNEALHWVHVDLRSNGSDSIIVLQIVSFDLVEETLQVMMPFPHPFPVNQYYIHNRLNFSAGIGTMANCLTLYMISRHDGVSIWMMKEYGVKESWIEVIRIPLEVLPTKVLSWRPLCISENGEVLIKCCKNSLALYDPKKKTFMSSFETHVEYWFESTTYISDHISDQREAITYLETLVSPQTGNDAG
ncbi:PREDICTED: F-box/kelch-repeat protein At3g06240-like [Fragaria vesca subsp. vesca]